MKKALKLFLPVLLIVALILPMGVSFAETPTPYWVQLSTLQHGMDNYNGIINNAHCTATAKTSSAKSNITLNVTVQKYNSGSYSNTTTAWTSSGTGAVEIDKYIRLDAGNYRIKVTVTVYSATGAYLETVTAYSNDIVI